MRNLINKTTHAYTGNPNYDPNKQLDRIDLQSGLKGKVIKGVKQFGQTIGYIWKDTGEACYLESNGNGYTVLRNDPNAN